MKLHQLPRRVINEIKVSMIAHFEKNYISSLLLAYMGNISKAAKAARKKRRTFWELIRKYKIDLEKIKLDGSIDQGKFALID